MAQRSIQKELVGVVISDKMQKTIVVLTKSRKPHPIYGKVMERRTKFSVHDEKSQAKLGDVVRIRSTRPLSKTKNWKLIEIVRASVGDIKVNINDVEIPTKKKKAQEAQS